MASNLFSPSPFPTPAAILAQLALSATAIGLTPAHSLARAAALPAISACVYAVLTGARAQMRPRWASLLGGVSFMFLLQYVDIGLVRRWNWADRGPVTSGDANSGDALRKEDEMKRETGVGVESNWTVGSVWARFRWAWSNMFALRHVNTPHEARNTPAFSDGDLGYIPSRAAFITREVVMAAVCYLLLDLMAQRAPPANAAELFDRSLVPVFRRLNEVTASQVKLRALSIAGFGLTFWALIRGYAAAAGALMVALGVDEPREWRPPFGSLGRAYSIGSFWGVVWHQNLRSLLTGPAAKVTYEVLELPRTSLSGRFVNVFISFLLSGAMHTCAGVAAGMSPKEFNVLHFFCTQALGVITEDLVKLAYLKATGQEGIAKAKREPPSLLHRTIGYVWVAAFMTWSGPVWLYPQASKPAPAGTNGSFLPYSMMKAWKAGDVLAG